MRRSMPLMAGLLVLALISPADAKQRTRFAADDSTPLISGNVSLVRTLPGFHPVGARFRDHWMFLTGLEGLQVFDIAKPDDPQRVAVLPIAHFENEDVDIGGDTLLISNDPSEGVGVLYVIDIKDPANPQLVTAMPNGTAVPDILLDFVTGFTQLIAPTPPVPSGLKEGEGHTASCIQDCRFAYLAGTGRGITIVDLRDRANPKVAKTFTPEITGLASHDVQVDADGLAWIVGCQGTAAYDVKDPLNPKLVYRTDENVKNSESLGITDPSDPNSGTGPLDYIHHDSLRFGSRASGKAEPKPGSGGGDKGGDRPGSGGTGGTGGGQGQSGGGGGDQGSSGTTPGSRAPAKKKTTKKKATKKKKKATSCRRSSKRARRAATRKRAACPRPRAKRAQLPTVSLPGGLGVPGTTAPGSTAPVSTAPASSPSKSRAYPAGGNGDVVGIVEEDYTRPTCQGAGSFQTWKITKRKGAKSKVPQLELLDIYNTELAALVNGRGWAPVAGVCSAHYFDERNGLVAEGWYEEGTRFLDVRDPKNIKQVGYWVPTKGETWSALYPPTDKKGEIVYALDFARGIDVLRIDRKDMRPRTAPIRRAWLQAPHGTGTGRTGLTQAGRFEYVCRLPVPGLT